MSNEYFIDKNDDELVAEVLSRVDAYDTFLTHSGAIYKYQQVYDLYYGLKNGAFGVRKSGDQNEIINISINHFRNYIKKTHAVITQQKLSYEPTAINSDYEAQSQCLLMKNILEYQINDKSLNKLIPKWVEYALLYSEYFLSATWDVNAGEPVAADLFAKREVMSGDIIYKLHHPINVIRDPGLKSNNNMSWVIIRDQVNKYDLAVQHPDFKEHILSAPTLENRITDIKMKFITPSEDLIEVITLYHDQTPACPKGIKVVLIGDKIIEKSINKYKKLPVCRLSASDIENSILAYSVSFDLVAIQEAITALLTASLSNNLTFALQNIYCSDPNIDYEDLSSGMRLFKGAAKPEAIQLTASSPELYKLVDLLQNHAQLITSISSTQMGQPEASLKSGASLALVSSMAIQSLSDLSASYVEAMSDVANLTKDIFQNFANAPMLISIGGKGKAYTTKPFMKDDINKISKVFIKVGNPLAQTTAGRLQIADQLMQNGMITDPHKYLEVVETGSLEALDNDAVTEQMLVRQENESLKEGQEVIALLIDNHGNHINAHRTVLSDPEVRKKPEIVQAVLAHIQEHIDLIRQVPPDLANIIGMQQPAPQGPAAPGEAPQPQDPNMPADMPSMPSLPNGAPAQAQQSYDTIQPTPGVNPAPTQR